MGGAAKSVGHGLKSIGKVLGKAVKKVGGFTVDTIRGSVAPYQRLYRDLGNDPVNGVIELAGLAYGGDLGLRVAEGGVDAAKGHQSPEQFARNTAAQYAGQQLGKGVGSSVAGSTGSNIAGQAAGGFAGGTAAGVIQGKSADEALRQGAQGGLTAGVTQALVGSPQKDNPLAQLGRQFVSQATGQQFSDLLGNDSGRDRPASPYAQVASGVGASPNVASAATAGAGPGTTGGAVDISGSDVNEPRRNVWNQGSLRVKDALGA